MGAPPSRSRDVSQPSLGIENEHGERLTTPPLSPMYSSDGQPIQHGKGKSQSLYGKPSSGTSMETHWEEVVYMDRKWDKNRKLTDFTLDGDDTESELIAIPESDMSDSTLQGSAHNSFEDTPDEICCPLTSKIEKVCATVKIQKPYETAVKGQKEVYIGYASKKTARRPTWIIGSEEDSVKSWENKKYKTHDNIKITETTNNHKNSKNCSKISTSDLAYSLTAMPSVSMAKTVTTDAHKQLLTSSPIETDHINRPMGKNKKIIEPSITPVCTPVSDCEDCYRNSHVMLPASIERLLPIGASRSQGKYARPILKPKQPALV